MRFLSSLERGKPTVRLDTLLAAVGADPIGDVQVVASGKQPSKGKRSRLSRRTLLGFAAKLGLREKAAGNVLDRLLDTTSNLDDALSDTAIPFDNTILQRTRCELMVRRKHLL